MVFSGGRIPDASVPTGTGLASQRGSLVRRGRRSAAPRPQGRLAAVDRRQSVRHGSEQRTAGQPSLAGSRGGEGTRVSPCRNAGQFRAVRPFATLSRFASARSCSRVAMLPVHSSGGASLRSRRPPLAKCRSKASSFPAVSRRPARSLRSLAVQSLVPTAPQPHRRSPHSLRSFALHTPGKRNFPVLSIAVRPQTQGPQLPHCDRHRTAKPNYTTPSARVYHALAIGTTSEITVSAHRWNVTRSARES